MKRFKPAFILVALILMAQLAFAQVAAVPAPTPDTSAGDFTNQVIAAIQGFGGMNWMLKVSTIVLLLGATMKVSFLEPLWNKLGNFKAAFAPVLGLIGGLLSYFGGGVAFSLPALAAYTMSGAGALALHEILDMVKSIPGLGTGYVAVINFISQYLGGPVEPPAGTKT
jgi:hypothetical protein